MDLEDITNKLIDALEDGGVAVDDLPTEDLRTGGWVFETEIDGEAYEVIVRRREPEEWGDEDDA